MATTRSASSGDPTLSLIVCTYNRAALLELCLSSMASEWVPGIAAEVIVVDNNCTDDTAAVVERVGERLPILRRIIEPRQGLSHARNAGATTATGDYLAFIDDDATLGPGYLLALARILRDRRPDLAGGPILPRFDGTLPDWFDPAIETRDQRVSGFSATATISGGNFIVRRDVYERVGPFDASLGMVGARQGFGEDRAFVERYRALTPPDRQRVYYSDELTVRHYTAPAKIDRRYQARRRFLNAEARERIFVAVGKRSPARSLVLASGRLVLLPLTAANRFRTEGWSPRTRFAVRLDLADALGRWRGAIGARREGV